jgi:hypothetical protein
VHAPFVLNQVNQGLVGCLIIHPADNFLQGIKSEKDKNAILPHPHLSTIRFFNAQARDIYHKKEQNDNQNKNK